MSANMSPRGSVEEEVPLLSPTNSEASIDSRINAPAKKEKPWVFLCILVFFLVAIIDVGGFLAEPPKTRVFEAILCLRYYQEHDPSKIAANGAVPESLCKVNAVQEKLATIFGWQELWDAIPSMLLAVPYGTLADKYGRKWIFCLGLLGLQLQTAWVLLICWFRNLPLQLTWFSSAFTIIGGGSIVVTAIGLTMVSDLVPPEKRTSIFLYLFASVLVAEILAPLMAAELMKYGDWLPLLLALAIQQIGMTIAVFFPETLHLRDIPEPIEDGSDENPEPAKDTGLGIKAQLNHYRDAFHFLRRDVKLALIIFTFLANRLGRQSLQLLLRYASKRYHWTIQKAAYLLSFRAATNLIALTVFIPLVNLVLLKLARLTAHRADIYIARGSVILVTCSMLVMAAAATPALLIFGLLVYNLGTGYSAAMRSISIHTVGGQSSPDIGRLFAVVAVMEGIGAFIAGPLLSTMFQWGMSLGEPWIGMPFLIAGLIFIFVASVTFMISEKDQIVLPTTDNTNESTEAVSSAVSLGDEQRSPI